MMSNILNDQKAELLQAIEKSNDLLEQLAVCIEAYQRIKQTESAQQMELFSWFLETSEATWFYRNQIGEQSVDLEALLHDQDDLDEGNDALLQLLESFQENLDDDVEPSKISANQTDVSKEDLSYCSDKFSRLIMGLIDLCFKEYQSSVPFYTKIWEMMESLLSFCSDIEHGICIYFIVCDYRIPYGSVRPGLRMDDKTYKRITEQITPMLRKMMCIYKASRGQRTESASQLLWLLNELDNFEEKTVLFSQFIANIESDN